MQEEGIFRSLYKSLPPTVLLSARPLCPPPPPPPALGVSVAAPDWQERRQGAPARPVPPVSGVLRAGRAWRSVCGEPETWEGGGEDGGGPADCRHCPGQLAGRPPHSGTDGHRGAGALHHRPHTQPPGQDHPAGGGGGGGGFPVD